MFGRILFVFNDRAVVLFDMTREDNILSGCYLLVSASGNDLPVEFRGDVERMVRSGELIFHDLVRLLPQVICSIIMKNNSKEQFLALSLGSDRHGSYKESVCFF